MCDTVSDRRSDVNPSETESLWPTIESSHPLRFSQCTAELKRNSVNAHNKRNILARANTPEIQLYMPYEQVKSVLLERTEQFCGSNESLRMGLLI